MEEDEAGALSKSRPYRHDCPQHGIEVCTCRRGPNIMIDHLCRYTGEPFEGRRYPKWELHAEIRVR